MKYLIYTRVSPRGSTYEGETSVGMQEQICREYIERQNGIVAGVVCDELISGSHTNRPGIQEVFTQIDSGAADWDAICVYKMSRLTRSLLDQLLIFRKFVENNKGIVSATEPHFDYSTPSGRFLLSQIAAANQYTREVNAENTRNKMISIASKGEWPAGQPPFGYCRGKRKDNVLYIDPRKAAVVREIFNMYISSVYMTKDICKKFHMGRQQVLNILRNKIYVGKIVYASKEFPGKHESIIDDKLFQAAQRKLPDKRHKIRPKSAKYDYLLSGILRCHCGRFMTPASAKSSQYHYYRCTDNVTCKNRVSAPDLEKRVISSLRGINFSDEAKKKLYAEIEKRRLDFLTSKEPEILSLEKALAQTRKEQERIYQVLLEMRGDNARFLNQRLEDLTHEIELFEEQLKKFNLLKRKDKRIYDEMSTMVENINNLSTLLKKYPGNKEIERQAIITNVEKISEVPDGSFWATYNYSSSSHQVWQPRLDSNQD